jgi:hypothetical protein
MSNTHTEFWNLINVIWAIRERQKGYEVGSEAWGDCEIQASIRETRLAKIKTAWKEGANV